MVSIASAFAGPLQTWDEVASEPSSGFTFTEPMFDGVTLSTELTPGIDVIPTLIGHGSGPCSSHREAKRSAPLPGLKRLIVKGYLPHMGERDDFPFTLELWVELVCELERTNRFPQIHRVQRQWLHAWDVEDRCNKPRNHQDLLRLSAIDTRQ